MELIANKCEELSDEDVVTIEIVINGNEDYFNLTLYEVRTPLTYRSCNMLGIPYLNSLNHYLNIPAFYKIWNTHFHKNKYKLKVRRN